MEMMSAILGISLFYLAAILFKVVFLNYKIRRIWLIVLMMFMFALVFLAITGLLEMSSKQDIETDYTIKIFDGKASDQTNYTIKVIPD